MSPRIEQLREAVEVMPKVKAQYEKPVPVVEPFAITGHPKAKRCYAWSFLEGNEPRHVTALEIPLLTPHKPLWGPLL